jgi:hypothetical protein
MDNEIFNRNFDYLLKVNDFKVRYVEEQCDVAQGYFFRIKRDDTLPNTKVLIKLSRLFKVTIDALVTEDMSSGVSDKINLLCNFIDKLIDDIDAGKIDLYQCPNDTESNELYEPYAYKLEYTGTNKSIIVDYPNTITICNDHLSSSLISLRECPKVRAHMDKLWTKIRAVDNEFRMHLTDTVIELMEDILKL